MFLWFVTVCVFVLFIWKWCSYELCIDYNTKKEYDVIVQWTELLVKIMDYVLTIHEKLGVVSNKRCWTQKAKVAIALSKCVFEWLGILFYSYIHSGKAEKSTLYLEMCNATQFPEGLYLCITRDIQLHDISSMNIS